MLLQEAKADSPLDDGRPATEIAIKLIQNLLAELRRGTNKTQRDLSFQSLCLFRCYAFKGTDRLEGVMYVLLVVRDIYKTKVVLANRKHPLIVTLDVLDY